MTDSNFSVAVFPFLKTSAPIEIGGHLFRSTCDTAGLPADQLKAITEIAAMLFVQSNLRVKTASYAIVPDLEVHSNDRRLHALANLRNVLAYFYAAPHDVLEDVFLAPEEISLVIFKPALVSALITRSDYHTVRSTSEVLPEPDRFHDVPGYRGLYNFSHAFWIEPGSPLYGPKPHMTLNMSQDLYADLGYRIADRHDYRLLHDLLSREDTPASLRIHSALRWFNAANEYGAEAGRSLLNLAIAFEALLGLPENSKTDRLVDAICLLLGRPERLDDWAAQFYAARSRVAHEGEIGDRYFYVSNSGKQASRDIYGSLMLYGRQIFQLCVGTILVGIDLAEKSNLREKFISNNERYKKIYDLLDDKAVSVSKKLSNVEPVVRSLERYRLVANSIDAGLMLATVKMACQVFLAANEDLPENLSMALAKCAATKRQDKELDRLAAVDAVYGAFRNIELATLTAELRVVRDLSQLVWLNLFQRFYWLRAQTAE